MTRTSDPASGRHSDTSISTCSGHSRDFYIPVDAFAEESAEVLRRILRELKRIDDYIHIEQAETEHCSLLLARPGVLQSGFGY
jgi:hypothetical protein